MYYLAIELLVLLKQVDRLNRVAVETVHYRTLDRTLLVKTRTQIRRAL